MWGEIDGIHIHLTKKPSEKQVPPNYFNHLKFLSIFLQGVCDHEQRFLKHHFVLMHPVDVMMLLILGF